MKTERPYPPTLCKCGSTHFTWDAGYRGSQTEPPEPSGWYCAECENRDFEERVYRAMLDAAPPPPAPPTDDERMRVFGEALDEYHAASYYRVDRSLLATRNNVLALHAAALKSQADATDAARYRWLREGAHGGNPAYSAMVWNDTPEELDAWIDAARGAK